MRDGRSTCCSADPLIGALFAVAWYLVEPAPPTRVAIAAGPPDGAYFGFAHRYAAFFHEHRIQLDVIETTGTPRNLELLADGGADLAIIQAGVASLDERAQLTAVARIGLEPIWLFHRTDEPIERLTDLCGRRAEVTRTRRFPLNAALAGRVTGLLRFKLSQKLLRANRLLFQTLKIDAR